MVTEVERDFIESKIELVEDLISDFKSVLHGWDNDGDEMREYNEDIYKYFKNDDFKYELVDICECAFICDRIGFTRERFETVVNKLENELINLKGRL